MLMPAVFPLPFLPSFLSFLPSSCCANRRLLHCKDHKTRRRTCSRASVCLLAVVGTQMEGGGGGGCSDPIDERGFDLRHNWSQRSSINLTDLGRKMKKKKGFPGFPMMGGRHTQGRKREKGRKRKGGRTGNCCRKHSLPLSPATLPPHLPQPPLPFFFTS